MATGRWRRRVISFIRRISGISSLFAVIKDTRTEKSPEGVRNILIIDGKKLLAGRRTQQFFVFEVKLHPVATHFRKSLITHSVSLRFPYTDAKRTGNAIW